jgi:glutathione synthase/RimK-type ligase-like ATP-grasp enzyme
MHKILVTNTPKLVIAQFDFIERAHDTNLSEVSLALNYEGDFGSDILRRLSAYGIPVIGGSRLHKHEQAVVMERLNIEHPKSYFNRKKLEPFKTIEEFDSYVDMDEFVVKPVLGARGIGVKKINRAKYKSCIENIRSVDEVFREEKEFLMNNDDLSHSQSYIEDSFKCGMLVQEPIDVKREFRVLYFKPNTVLVYERVRKPGQFCGNLTHGSEPTKVDLDTLNRYITPFHPKFNLLLDELKYPWLSIDLYVDQNDNVGVFEFQMEFAYAGFDHREVRYAMQKSIEYFLPK